MERFRQTQQNPRPDHTTWSFPTELLRFRDVDGKRLGGEARILYVALYTHVGDVDRAFDTTVDQLATMTGLSHQGAARALRRLLAVGLTTKVDKIGDRWIIALQHPETVARARLGSKPDPQLPLRGVDDAPAVNSKAAPDVNAQPAPLRLRPQTSSELSPPREGQKSKSVYQPSLSPSQGGAACDRTSGASGPVARAGSAGEGDRPRPLTDVMGEWFSRTDTNPHDRDRQIEQLANAIENQVADAALKRSVATKAATAVVDGRLKRRELKRLLQYVDEQTQRGLRVGRWAAFVGALKTRFREDGIEW